ncbi:helix-turn-helix transcriptional regulator [Achromobacter insuavis]
MPVPRTDLDRFLSTLTPRERQVVAYVAAGRPNKVIAIDLDISLRTAEAHRARIFAKLGVRNAMQLACRLCAHGQLGVSPVLGAPLPCGRDAAGPAEAPHEWPLREPARPGPAPFEPTALDPARPEPIPPAPATPASATRYAPRAEPVHVILADCCAALVNKGYWSK